MERQGVVSDSSYSQSLLELKQNEQYLTDWMDKKPLVCGEQAYILLCRISEFRECGMYLLTDVNISNMNIKQAIQKVAAEGKNEEDQNQKDVKIWEDIKEQICEAISTDTTFDCPDPMVFSALYDLAKAMHDTVNDQQMLGVSILDHHIAFSLVEIGATLDLFPDVIDSLMNEYLSRKDVVHLMQIENHLVTIRNEDREQSFSEELTVFERYH